jgi:hypothetical protein
MVIGESLLYNPIWVNLWIESIPFWRKILARYFEKYKLTPEEYREWLFKTLKQ